MLGCKTPRTRRRQSKNSLRNLNLSCALPRKIIVLDSLKVFQLPQLWDEIEFGRFEPWLTITYFVSICSYKLEVYQKYF